LKRYIELLYEPLDEEFEEKKYFMKEYDRNMLKKLRVRRKKSLATIEIK
jgi:hypothetical protein